MAATVRRQVLVAAAILLLSPASVWAWGCEGHQAVAIIAEKHLNRHAREEADKLLQSVPIDPVLESRCRGQGLDPIVDSAAWADDLRKFRPETSAWHYIDIPLDAPRGDLAEFCPASRGCVTRALAQQVDLLRNPSNPRETRADALRFVIHLVADLHQPLHCATNNDMGGNCVPVDFFGEFPVEKNLESESYSPNLHSIWDYDLVHQIIGRMTEAQWADSLDRQFRLQEENWQKAGVNLEDWTWAGHKLARTVAYGKLPVAILAENEVPVSECRDDRHVSRRMLRLHERVSQQYVDAVEPTIDEQITKAGVRLAIILNQIWP
jgi:hypothetical protein